MGAMLIPLEGQRAPALNPYQAAVQGQEAGLQAASELQRQKMNEQLMDERAQLIKAEQLKNEEMGRQAAATASLNQAIQKSVTTKPDGSFSIDHDAVVRNLAEAGFGSSAPKYMSGVMDSQRKAAQVYGERLKNENLLFGQATQLLQGVTDEASYQQIRPQVVGIAKQLGISEDQIPAQYDPKSIDAMKSMGMKAKDFAWQAYHAADLAWKKTLNAPKIDREWQQQVYGDLDGVQSQDQLDFIRRKYKDLGAPQQILDTLPAEYDPDEVDRLKKLAIAPDKRADVAGKEVTLEEKRRQSRAGQLAAMSSPDAYSKFRGRLPFDEASIFPPAEKVFGSDGKMLPDARKQILALGMTPIQQTTAAHQENTENEQRRFHNAQVGHWNRQDDRADDLADYRMEGGGSGDGQGAKSRAVDVRQAKRDIFKLEDKEAALNKMRRTLGTAISSGGATYVDRTGALKEATSLSDSAKDAFLEENRQRFNELTDELKKVTQQKYGLYKSIGSTPQYSLEQVHAAIDEGSNKLFGTKSAAAPSPATKPAAAAPTPAAPAPAQKPPQQAAPQQPQTRPGAPKVGDTRQLTQADVDRLAKAGHAGFRAGQTVKFTGTGWQ